jgi:hypothetical protein
MQNTSGALRLAKLPTIDELNRIRFGFHETVSGYFQNLPERPEKLFGRISFHLDAVSLPWNKYLNVVENESFTHTISGTLQAEPLTRLADFHGTLVMRCIRRRVYYDFVFESTDGRALRLSLWRRPGPTWLLPPRLWNVKGWIEEAQTGIILASVGGRVIRAGLLSPAAGLFRYSGFADKTRPHRRDL